MTARSVTVVQQLRQHAVALISLVIAVTTLGYNTWRNEVTEHNRNIRAAAFEVLKNLGELQLIVNQAHYGDRRLRVDPLRGWGHVALIFDLSQLLPPAAPAAAADVRNAWEQNWQRVTTDESAVESVSHEIDSAREAVLDVLHNLH